MTEKPVLWEHDDRGVATVTLNRPNLNNAYNADLIDGLHQAMDALGGLPDLRVVVIKGAGKHFQAGADLKWLNAVRDGNRAENIAASRATALAVDRLNRLPLPTVALVQGFCVGGGTGLLSACDVVIAEDTAKFAISEVRWGLTASIIFPQLNDAIGVRQVRRYALTGERFDAAEARRIGLVHEVVAAGELAATGERIVAALLENAPAAIAETKQLALAHAFGDVGGGTFEALVNNHAAKRQSDEAAEGLASFAEKRPADWLSVGRKS
ncbi:MAG: enoyl-CoA hydratase/isomerase family protein [Hyphomicrobiaceae bacterium]|nr:enoyl-CoA hydratase/isomerase family protein [Hyphomicrobiaceae bacterium]